MIPTFPTFALLLLTAAVPVDVSVEDPTGCLSPADAEAIRALWNEADHDVALVSVVVLPTAAGRALTLRLVNGRGEIALERRFALDATDCPKAPALVEAVLRAHLASLTPMAPTDVELRGPVPIESPPPNWLEIGLRGALSFGAWPPDGEAALTLVATAGITHAVAGGIL